MDKDNEVQKVKNLSEIVQPEKPSSKSSGCSHYKRKARFVVCIHKGHKRYKSIWVVQTGPLHERQNFRK